jgi:hypothetical protein
MMPAAPACMATFDGDFKDAFACSATLTLTSSLEMITIVPAPGGASARGRVSTFNFLAGVQNAFAKMSYTANLLHGSMGDATSSAFSIDAQRGYGSRYQCYTVAQGMTGPSSFVCGLATLQFTSLDTVKAGQTIPASDTHGTLTLSLPSIVDQGGGTQVPGSSELVTVTF